MFRAQKSGTFESFLYWTLGPKEWVCSVLLPLHLFQTFFLLFLHLLPLLLLLTQAGEICKQGKGALLCSDKHLCWTLPISQLKLVSW